MSDIIKQKFGERLKNLRKSQNYTQAQFAEIIGINTRQMARIEAGESFVTAETIYKVCLFLKISPKILFDFDIENHEEKNKSLDSVLQKILKLSHDTDKIDYIDIAIDSLTSKSSLEKLKLIIKGIELNN